MEGLGSFYAKRAAIIYNPVARGLSRRQHLLQRTIAALSGRGVEAQLVTTTAPGSASRQVRECLNAGYDLIVAAGGDGTINEVASGMLHSRVPLAILPGGTANVLARELRLPINLERAAGQMLSWHPVRIAVGGLRLGSERRTFICMAGAGLDADIVARLNPGLKAAIGKLAYYVAGFSHIFQSLPEFEVTVDGKSCAASFALVSRVRNYGGDLEIAREASLLRDDFEVVLFRGAYSARYVPYLVGVALKQVHRMNGCSMLRGSTVTCHAAAGLKVNAQLDGELVGTLPVTAELVRDALTLLVPTQYLAREQAYITVPACA